MKQINHLEIRWEEADAGFDDAFAAEPSDEKTQEFQELLENTHSGPEDAEPLAVGDQVQAVICELRPESEDVLLELDGKSSAIIAKADLLDQDGKLSAEVGDTIEAFVVSLAGGEIVLGRSLTHAVAKKHALESAYINKMPVKGRVAGVNKGGYEIALLGRTAFCPLSQMDLSFVEKPEVFIGKELEFLIQKWGSRELVVSRSALLAAQAHKFLAALKEAQETQPELEGTVTQLRDFGALVDLGGGLSGMVHISELSYGHPKHPSEVVEIGERVRVKVLSIGENEGQRLPRIALSMKALASDPWDTLADKVSVGANFSAKVVRLTDFGAFVSLLPGIDGLIHLSELSWVKRVSHPREVLQVGDLVSVRVLTIDTAQKRIALSMKSLEDDPWYEVEQTFPEGSVHTAVVEQLKAAGAVMSLAPGLSGFLPVGPLKAAFGEGFRKKASPGQELPVLVAELDKAAHRLLLSLPGLNTAAEEAAEYQQFAAKQAAKQQQGLKAAQPQGSFGAVLQASLAQRSKK